MIINRPARSRVRALVVLVFAVTLVLGIASGTAGAISGLSFSRQALTDTNRDCNGSPLSSATRTVGSAAMLQTPRAFGNPAYLSTIAIVRGATPNATYNIRIFQEGPDGLIGNCDVVIGKFSTDASGNGLMLGATPLVPGATKWWVAINNQQNFFDFFDTALVTIAS